jgi:hypothetical protein
MIVLAECLLHCSACAPPANAEQSALRAVVVYALVRRIIFERRLMAMIRRQPHRWRQEEDAEYFEEIRRAVARFE